METEKQVVDSATPAEEPESGQSPDENQGRVEAKGRIAKKILERFSAKPFASDESAKTQVETEQVAVQKPIAREPERRDDVAAESPESGSAPAMELQSNDPEPVVGRSVYVAEETGEPSKNLQAGGSKPTESRKTPEQVSSRRLQRMLDVGIDSEIEEAMSGFDVGRTLAATSPAEMPISTAAEPGTVEKKSVRVVAIHNNDIFVDLGGKTQGVVSKLQFEQNPPKVGDLVELLVDHYDSENELYVMRRPGTAQEADWGTIARGMIVDASVQKVNKGGLEVKVNGIRGFLPAGQASIDHIPDLSVFLNQTLRCQVMEADIASRNLVVSRRLVLEQERKERAEATLASIAEGKVFDGEVKRLLDFGAFVDIGGIDGLLHVKDLAWHRVAKPEEVLTVGQKVKVVVLKFDRETKKISLGLKQLSQSPWLAAADKFRPGAVVSGTVTRLADFGAFVELEPGIEGLVHVSEMSRQRVRRPADVVKPGQAVEVKVLDVDPAAQRMSLSLKQAEPEPEAAPVEPGVAEEPPPEPPKKPKKQQILKGGLGGSGPLFG